MRGEGRKVQVEFNCCQLIRERVVMSDWTRKEIEIKDPKEDKLTFGTGLEDGLRLEEMGGLKVGRTILNFLKQLTNCTGMSASHTLE